MAKLTAHLNHHLGTKTHLGSLRHTGGSSRVKGFMMPNLLPEIKWQLDYKDTKINKNPFVTPNNKSCINKRCRLENWGFFCIRYFSKTKSKPAKKFTGQCFSTEMEVACENSANLEQETKTTKIVTCPLFPLASSYELSYIHLYSSPSMGILRTYNMTSSQLAW